ncbi:MAG: sigma 54-interacting transcriptional regulator [Pseudomonadota bacterium]
MIGPETTADANYYVRLLSSCSLFNGDFCIDWLVDLMIGMKPSRILVLLQEATADGTLVEKGTGYYCFTSLKKRKKWGNNLSVTERTALHGHIADILMRDGAEDERVVHLAADHLLHISNDIQRCTYLVKVGDLHRKAFRNEEALQCYRKVLDDLDHLSGEEEDLLFSDTAIKYSKISTGRHDTETVLATLNSAVARAERIESLHHRALLKMHMAKNEWLTSRYSRALKHFAEGWSLAKEIENPRTLRSARVFSTFFHFWQGRFAEAIRIYELSMPEIEKYPQRGFPLLAQITVGYCYCQIGRVTQGLGMLDAIRVQCEENGNRYMGAYALGNIGNILLEIGRIDESIQFLETASEQAREVHNDWVWISVKIARAYAYFRKGREEKAVDCLQEFLRESRKVQTTVYLYPYLMELCLAMREGKLPQTDGVDLEKEIRDTTKGPNIFMKGVAYRCRSILELLEGRPQGKILRSLRASLRWLEESGSRVELLKSRLTTARVELAFGNEQEARELVLAATKALPNSDDDLMSDDLKALVKDRPVGENLLKEILNLGRQVVTIREYKDLIQHIMTTVNGITGAERGAIFLMDESRAGLPDLTLRASKNLTSEVIGHPAFASSMKMIKDVARTGKGRVLGAGSSIEPGHLAKETIRSRICVPMILRDKPVGVLYHDNRLLSSAFKESDLELLSYFAALAAIALDNAGAYEEIRRLNAKLSQENLYYREENLKKLHFEDIVGESTAIRRVLSQVDQVCGTDATVLIVGETGVGKELVARAVHRHSPRRDKPFIRVHCSALPETLIAGELFGHEKGAFTGAVQRRIGRFELADGGTLFLDEIGDISLEIQVKLLRVLQTKEFERVGGNETLRSDFRLVAATNRDIEQAVKSERFRADLYYRLAVFPVHVPPLRERKDDIPLLAYYFLDIYSKKMGKKFSKIPGSQMDKMLTYHWPGNVRELENVIERGTILSNGPLFRVPQLGEEHQEPREENGGMTLRDNERRHILWALDKTGWKVRGKSGAAEILGVPPSTLAFRMKKLGIQRAKKPVSW